MWIGTDTGLFRFDGKSFERYHPSSGEDLRPGTVRSLLATRDGGLWIGYSFAGASFLNQGHNVTFGKQEGLASGSITSFVQESSGVVWATTSTGLLKLQGSSWRRMGEERWHFTDEAPLLVDGRGTLWVASGKRLLYLKQGASRFVLADTLPDDEYAVGDAPDGSLWITFPRSSIVRKLIAPDGRLAASSKSYHYRANRIFFRKDGSLWMVTDNQGLYRIQSPDMPGAENPVQHFSETDGLTGDDAFALLMDREGSTWIATTKGIDQFRPAALTGVPLPKNWFRIGIVANGPDSILAVGKGIVKVGRNGSASMKGGLKQVASVYRDPQGTIWIGEDDGLWQYSGAGLRPIPLPPVLDPFFHVAQAITMDRSGGLWVSFLHTGFMYYAAGRWMKPPFPSASVHDPGLFAYTDSLGRIWFGLQHSRVEVLSGGDHFRYGPEKGLRVGSVAAIYEHRGQVWIGGEEGLAFQQNDAFRQLHLENDAALEGVSGVAQTSSGDLWVNQASGIIRVPAGEVDRAFHDPEHRVRFELYNYLDGLTDTASQIRPNPTVIQTSSGRLYFATRTGVVWIDPDRAQKNSVPSNVFIQSLSFDGKLTRDPAELRLPVHANAIEIDYTATSLQIPERVRFRYKLEGFDRDWQNAGTRRQAFYSGLPPARYRFRVLACNSAGVWNENGASVTFEIPPSFLQSMWFKALCAIAGFTLLGVLYRVRVGLLTKQVKTRLYERLTERERIARDLHDTFFQGIQGLLLHFNTATSQLKQDEPARAIFEETLKKSDMVMLQGRDLVLDLRTGSGDGSLSEALSAAGGQLRELHDVNFRVVVHGEPRNLHPIVFEEVYRLGREALVNAFRHSHATAIEAELNYEVNELRLCVRDNGVGVDSKVLSDGGRENHWGLPGMRERAQKIGAVLDIWSRKGAGTEIELKIQASVAYRSARTTSPFRWLGSLLPGKIKTYE